MKDESDKLKNLWQKAKAKNPDQVGADHIIRLAKQQMESSVNLQLGTIVILFITLVGLIAFFIYLANFRQTISHIGMAFMLGGLAIRIIIELISIWKSKKINLGETALKSNSDALSYYQFRKFVNGPVTLTIMVLYSIGFYMLTPEFSLYFSTPAMILIDLSYLVIAAILTRIIRKTIKREMKMISEMLRIQQDIQEKGSR